MHKSAPWLLRITALIVGCALTLGCGPRGAVSDQGLTARSGSSCFTSGVAKVGSPAPSYILRQFGPQPLFSGGGVLVEGEGWPPGTIRLYTLPEVEGATAYGRRPDLIRCLGSLITPVGETMAQGGRFTWEGRVSGKVGERPRLLAVNPAGDYFIQPLPWFGAGRLVAPYRLTVGGQASRPDEAPPVHTITLGHPFALVGSELQDGSVQIRVEDEAIGAAEIRGGLLSVSDLVVPTTLLVSGSPVAAPGDYQMFLVASNRPSDIEYRLSLRVLPTVVDQQRLAALWRLPQVQPLAPFFPAAGGTAPCTLQTSLGPVKAACTTQIRASQPSDLTGGMGQAHDDWRVITLRIDWEDPRKEQDPLAQIRRFAFVLLVDKDTHIQRILRVGDSPPVDAWSRLEVSSAG